MKRIEGNNGSHCIRGCKLRRNLWEASDGLPLELYVPRARDQPTNPKAGMNDSAAESLARVK